MKKALPVLGMLLVFWIGLGVLLYPTVSNWLYERNASKVIGGYNELLERLPAYDREEQLRLAEDYNKALTGQDIRDPFVPGSGVVLPDNYISVLNFGGVMGTVSIPKIGVELPIRHGTGEAALQTGAGHIEATAFPIGGEGCHCVLTGHRGLAEAKLFTDLDRLEEGDVFLLHVMDDTLCYQVDQILVVEPKDVESLRPLPDKDYVTLVTCTPYGINSHRLLVRGERIPYTMEELPEEILEKLETTVINWRGIAVLGFALLWAVLILAYWLAGRRRRRYHYRR